MLCDRGGTMKRIKSLQHLLRRAGSSKSGLDEADDNLSTLTRWSPVPTQSSSSCGSEQRGCEASQDNVRHPPAAVPPTLDAATEPCWLLGSRYSFQSLINRGGHGAVVKAVDSATTETVAVKLIPRTSSLSVESVTRELVHHAALQGHPHIVALREAFLTESHLAVVLEYADRGDLAEHLSRHVHRTGCGMSEPAARRIFQQLVAALDWMHRKGIASRDIKCDNILLSGPDETVKLADFGWACADQERGYCGTTLCGTPEYMSPEVLRRRPDAGSLPSDVWAAGVVLWALVGGGFPFLKPEEERLNRMDRIRVMAPRIVLGCTRPLPYKVSPALGDLLRRMLKIDPATRITTAEILRHPWVCEDLPPRLTFLNDRLEAAARSQAAVTACASAISKMCGGASSDTCCSGGGSGSGASCRSRSFTSSGTTSDASTASCCGSPTHTGAASRCGRVPNPSAPLALARAGMRQSANDLRALVREAAGSPSGSPCGSAPISSQAACDAPARLSPLAAYGGCGPLAGATAARLPSGCRLTPSGAVHA